MVAGFLQIPFAMLYKVGKHVSKDLQVMMLMRMLMPYEVVKHVSQDLKALMLMILP